jgi:E3 ubiquitin-protein ligase HUWE1
MVMQPLTITFSLCHKAGRGKEEGLGLLACDIDASKLGAALHFEFYAEGDASDSNNNNDRNIFGLQVIHIPELHMQTEGDVEFLQQLVERYKVPPRLRFSFLTRLWFARAYPHLN